MSKIEILKNYLIAREICDAKICVQNYLYWIEILYIQGAESKYGIILKIFLVWLVRFLKNKTRQNKTKNKNKNKTKQNKKPKQKQQQNNKKKTQWI